jgi:hypothetical protein
MDVIENSRNNSTNNMNKRGESRTSKGLSWQCNLNWTQKEVMPFTTRKIVICNQFLQLKMSFLNISISCE